MGTPISAKKDTKRTWASLSTVFTATIPAVLSAEIAKYKASMKGRSSATMENMTPITIMQIKANVIRMRFWFRRARRHALRVKLAWLSSIVNRSWTLMVACWNSGSASIACFKRSLTSSGRRLPAFLNSVIFSWACFASGNNLRMMALVYCGCISMRSLICSTVKPSYPSACNREEASARRRSERVWNWRCFWSTVVANTLSAPLMMDEPTKMWKQL
mmetsp:Transcript_44062/g.133466  ORF Transcript_44062/g.133466 Transcript_44062/m.133466 type:complete len:217 (+) Transcript_44062:622-1272(+)